MERRSPRTNLHKLITVNLPGCWDEHVVDLPMERCETAVTMLQMNDWSATPILLVSASVVNSQTNELYPIQDRDICLAIASAQ